MKGTRMDSPTEKDRDQRIHIVHTLGKQAIETTPIATALRGIRDEPARSAYRILIKDNTPRDKVSGGGSGDHFLLRGCQVM